MPAHRLILVVAAVTVLMIAAVPAYGQGAALGSISGRVTDPTEAPVPDTSVTVTNTGTGTN